MTPQPIRPWRSPGAGRRGGRTTVSPAIPPPQTRTRDRVLSVPSTGWPGRGAAPHKDSDLSCSSNGVITWSGDSLTECQWGLRG